MWLLDVKTRKLVHFMDDRQVFCQYAVLSHTWQDAEVTFQDVKQAGPGLKKKSGYQKIAKVCDQAVRDEIPFAWIDTCCINKESSAELSEAINSMYRWYSHSAVCYAYLADVDLEKANFAYSPGSSQPAPKATQYQAFLRHSRWLTRGWTLQELIAPSKTVFYDKRWCELGNTSVPTLQVALADLTGIDTSLLHDRSTLHALPVAKRLSWAARRSTTREEDQAYSLLGTLGQNMPLLYGEGSRALLRLQEVVLTSTTDQSMLHWTPTDPSQTGTLLAPHLRCFEHCGELLHRPDVFEDEPHHLVSNALRVCLPMRELQGERGVLIAALNCTVFTRQYEQAVLELRRVTPMHLIDSAPKRDIFEVVRDDIAPSHQPVNEWRNGDGSWKDDVSMINATILKQSPSSTLCLDDEGAFDVLTARPPHCWDNRRRRFFVLGNLNSRRDLMPRGSLQLQFKDSTAEKFFVLFSQARFGGRYSIELSTKEDVRTGAPGASKSKYSSARLTLPESKRTVSATFLEGDGTVQGHDVLVMSPNLFPASKMIRVRVDGAAL
ncbi:hypothetical protein CKM354_000620200 [Cercospora kikuchii]|uniref:Heterokaryon incompatibility domain-containing protein n=1 Tax=Cercospora kikuchii TaxID=84275 RepID=A0A9P3CNK7_9PEZI|nr:uncharacterized protein CKM354_000620200 [Cercospora kikuchii]GIZ42955.1 hypothetical protein CKM354_000620200 [Cercospora kikuchii]